MEEIKNDFIRFWLEDGILHSEFIKNIIVGKEEMEQLIDLRQKLSNNQKQFWLYDLRLVSSMTKEARDLAEESGQGLLYASAVVVNSHITMFMFNIFVKLKSTNIPFKAFKEKDEALKWLNEIKVSTLKNVVA